MAAQFIPVDKNHEIIRTILRGIQQVREGGFNVKNALASLNALSDGNRDQAADFDLLASQCSITAGDYATANDAAKKLYDELNAVDGNLAAGLAAAEQLCGFLGT